MVPRLALGHRFVCTGLALTLASSVPLVGQTTTLASVASDGTFANDEARTPAISADGRWVAFDGLASNLVPGDGNGVRDVFVHDLLLGTTELVSVALGGGVANGPSGEACVSGDGRYVAFESEATDLIASDTNGRTDVFVRDRETGKTTRVSVSTGGVQGDGPSREPSISADGRLVAFSSGSTNLVPGDTNRVADVFVHDLWTGTTSRASLSAAGAQVGGSSFEPALSSDGSRLAFASQAADLVPGDTNQAADVFVRELQTGAIVRVSVSSTGLQGDGASREPALSADGSVAGFHSWATNLVSGDTNQYPDVFVHDLSSQQTLRVSVSSTGGQADYGSLVPSLSADGTQVAFMSYATNLGPWQVGADTIYAHDVPGGRTSLVSQSSSGAVNNHLSNFPSISADGRLVAFMSMADNLVPNPTSFEWKVLVHDRFGCTPTLATYCSASATSLAGCAASIATRGAPSVSAPGSFEVSSGSIPGGTLGVALWSLTGPAAIPFGTQGGLLCVQQDGRSGVLPAGGDPGTCNGELRVTLQDLQATSPAFGEVSRVVWLAFWFRDPASPDRFGLSNGLWFHLCP